MSSAKQIGFLIRGAAVVASMLAMSGCVTYPVLFDCNALGLKSVDGSEIGLQTAGFSFPVPHGNWCVAGQDSVSVTLASSPLLGQTLKKRPEPHVSFQSLVLMALEVELEESGIDTNSAVADFLRRWSNSYAMKSSSTGRKILTVEDLPRFNSLEIEVSSVSLDGALCARSRVRQEERGNPRARGTVLEMINVSYLCIHPTRAETYVLIGVSERYYQGHRAFIELMDDRFEQAVAAVSSLRFSGIADQ